MDVALWSVGGVTGTAFLLWIGLLGFRGGFWRADQVFTAPESEVDAEWPSVSVVVLARDEAEVIADTLPALLSQDYPGELHVFLVDDSSEDGTGALASRLGKDVGRQGA